MLTPSGEQKNLDLSQPCAEFQCLRLQGLAVHVRFDV